LCAAARKAKQQKKDQDTHCFIAGAVAHESLLAGHIKHTYFCVLPACRASYDMIRSLLPHQFYKALFTIGVQTLQSFWLCKFFKTDSTRKRIGYFFRCTEFHCNSYFFQPRHKI